MEPWEGRDYILILRNMIPSSLYSPAWEWKLDRTISLPEYFAAMEPVILKPDASGLVSSLKITINNDTRVNVAFQLVITEPNEIHPHPIHKHSNKPF